MDEKGLRVGLTLHYVESVRPDAQVRRETLMLLGRLLQSAADIPLIDGIFVALKLKNKNARHADFEVVVSTDSPVEAERIVDSLLRHVGFVFLEDMEVYGPFECRERTLSSSS